MRAVVAGEQDRIVVAGAKSKHWQQRWWASFALILVLVAPPLAAQAATSNTSVKPQNTTGGISLSPFLQNINVSPSDVTKNFNLTLTNHTNALQELDLATSDFGSLDDSGGVALEGSTGFTQQYGLTSWLSLGTDTVVLNPNESQTVPVSINNRQDLQPGGHYGAVVATVKSLDDQSGNHVVVNQQLVSLILVDKMGGEHYDLKLVSSEQDGNWLHLPRVVTLHFQNPGNVHVVPRGVIKLKNPAGKVLAQGQINTDSAYILPDSFRDIIVPLTSLGHTLPLPGLYHVEVDYRYDGITQSATKSYAVRYIALPLYLIFVAILLAAIWFLRRQKRRPKVHRVNTSKNR